MVKKKAKPCKVCKGKFRTPCMLCGWSLPKRKRNDTRTFLEQATEKGIIDRVEFLEGMAIKGNKFNMEGTGSDVIDQTLSDEIGYKFPQAAKEKSHCAVCKDRGFYYNRSGKNYVICACKEQKG